jgi:hypothetical protein
MGRQSRIQVEAAIRLIDNLLEEGSRGLHRSRLVRSGLGMSIVSIDRETRNLKNWKATLLKRLSELEKEEGNMIYLAVPYSHGDPEVREYRFKMANSVAGFMTAQGELVYSPISHTHAIAIERKLPTDWEYWEKHNRQMMAICSKLVVLRLDGWKESVGVRAEIKLARELRIPVERVDLADFM